MFAMLKSKNDNLERSSVTFDDLVNEVIKLRKEYGLLILPAKLTAKAFMQGALENAGTTEDAIIEIEKAIESRPQFQNTRRFIKKAYDHIIGGNCSRPSPKLNRLSCLIPYDEFGFVVSELSSISANPFTAFAIAVRQAIQKHPEAFGTVENMDEHERQLKECQARLQNLYQRIEREWGPGDVDIIPAGHDRNGPVHRITFKVSKGAVSVGARNSGEALINHLMNQKR